MGTKTDVLEKRFDIEQWFKYCIDDIDADHFKHFKLPAPNFNKKGIIWLKHRAL